MDSTYFVIHTALEIACACVMSRSPCDERDEKDTAEHGQFCGDTVYVHGTERA